MRSRYVKVLFATILLVSCAASATAQDSSWKWPLDNASITRDFGQPINGKPWPGVELEGEGTVRPISGKASLLNTTRTHGIRRGFQMPFPNLQLRDIDDRLLLVQYNVSGEADAAVRRIGIMVLDEVNQVFVNPRSVLPKLAENRIPRIQDIQGSEGTAPAVDVQPGALVETNSDSYRLRVSVVESFRARDKDGRDQSFIAAPFRCSLSVDDSVVFEASSMGLHFDAEGSARMISNALSPGSLKAQLVFIKDHYEFTIDVPAIEGRHKVVAAVRSWNDRLSSSAFRLSRKRDETIIDDSGQGTLF